MVQWKQQTNMKHFHIQITKYDRIKKNFTTFKHNLNIQNLNDNINMVNYSFKSAWIWLISLCNAQRYFKKHLEYKSLLSRANTSGKVTSFICAVKLPGRSRVSKCIFAVYQPQTSSIRWLSSAARCPLLQQETVTVQPSVHRLGWSCLVKSLDTSCLCAPYISECTTVQKIK